MSAEGVCSICLDSGGDRFLDCCLRGCVAVFHAECAERALAAAPQCPVCRREVGEQALGPVEAFLRLREFCTERYRVIERELETSERLCAYFFVSWAAASLRRPSLLRCCRRKREAARVQLL